MFVVAAPWFCSSSCSTGGGGEEDFLLNYTKAVLWEGLNHLARRDAIQEGDGEALTDFWRTDMVLLWSRKHLQLFNSSHQLITGIEGFYPERIRQDMKWNRVLNLPGTSEGTVRNPKKMGRSVGSLSEELDRQRDKIL
ncbi:hypothetical protein F7725_008618 [Dissostichus mawsoni]|uniref:Uncharacterized protein n=1 Tax=Dissostichus mawsoni TaxID=36200 RepID=A0A7J5Y7P5_DISMA|nr:hypothetical protein F7725_008618 [Dissostichus mawsoni]